VFTGSPRFPLISRATENMGDFYHSPLLPVVDQILSGRKAPRAWLNVIALSPGIGVLSEQPKTLYNRIDQPVCYVQACALGPKRKDLIQILFGILRDAVTPHALRALPASSFLPRDLTSAANSARPSRPM